MNFLNYFPEGIASDDSFLNRVEERNVLINRIGACKHTVLMAPRRYGKTSLVLKVADEIKLPYCTIDLLPAYSEEYVRDQIVSKIGQLAFQLLPRVKMAKEKLLNIFRRMKPEISIGAFGQRLTFTLSDKPLQDITDLLLHLDEAASHFRKKAVIFMDEFQQISQLKACHSIEAAVRHAVERSKNIAYVFSGSNRQLLRQMFDDSGRPLYRLCQTIVLERMSEQVYQTYLQGLAKEKWGKPLKDEVLKKIFEYSRLHPFYINVLCQRLWEGKKILDAEIVEEAWRDYIKTQRHMIAEDLTKLSNNQRRVLVGLAHFSTKHVQSARFTALMKLLPSSVQQALGSLIRKDLVYQNSDGNYHVLDPTIEYYLRNIISVQSLGGYIS